jgi:hypothetical protein
MGNVDTVARFTLVAEQFCAIVDSCPNLSRDELIAQVYSTLPKLIDQAICMPDVELDDSDEEASDRFGQRENTRLGHEEWQRLYHILGENLGDWNAYRQVFDPIFDTELIGGSLADDLADIYRDLKEGLVTNESCTASPEDKIWGWRFSFCTHWGKHAIDALSVLHTRLHQ